jgi:aspartate beta-hydroxylase
MTSAHTDAAVTQFYLGVATGTIEGEVAACEYYERALQQLPLLHAARNNLIRGLMRRGGANDLKQALEHAELSAGFQPGVAEMQYQLGVVRMQQGLWATASNAYEEALRLDPSHRGAYINGVHSLQQMPVGDKSARKRLEKIAKMGVQRGVWGKWQQRPPHLVPRLRSQPWWDTAAFPWCALLERSFDAIREEVLALRRGAPEKFTPVGGRAAHDHTLVAAGEWREFPLFGNGMKYADNCARCPRTAAAMECVAPAMELAMAAGGETLFSTLKPGTHLRPHCGSTNTRLTCHLGIVVPDGVSIRAGDEWREWREGECLVFDDSWEHEVQHRGSSDRVVLLINFWHPDLQPHERRIELNTFGYDPC